MATYSNKHWLLSHIRNSFIATDDTGICELVMLSDDIPSAYLKNLNLKTEDEDSPEKQQPHVPEELFYYPGIDDYEEEEEEVGQNSYEIHGDLGFHRQRLNTSTQDKLNKLEHDRRKAGKIQTICYTDSPVFDQFFEDKLKKVRPKTPPTFHSLMTYQLENPPDLPPNHYMNYAMFDGTGQVRSLTKTFKIFMKMLDEKQRNYPLTVTVIATALIHELIGLACFKCKIQYPYSKLEPVENYGLFLAEQNGDKDQDFPPIEPSEVCSKFNLNYFALDVKESYLNFNNESPSVRNGFISFSSMTSEAAAKAEQAIIDMRVLQRNHFEEENRLYAHNTLIEAPQYKVYRIVILNKARIKSEIQLGVSGEKIEIDPIALRNSKFWPKQKPSSLSMDCVAECEKIEDRQKKTLFRIYYTQNALSAETSSPPDTANRFKTYDFEADTATANEIIAKINNILKIHSNSSRREFLNLKEEQQKSGLHGKRKANKKIFN